jgi:hypothetical protein
MVTRSSAKGHPEAGEKKNKKPLAKQPSVTRFGQALSGVFGRFWGETNAPAEERSTMNKERWALELPRLPG